MGHSNFDNLLFVIKNWFRWDTRGALYAFLRVPVAIVLPIMTALIPKQIVDMITAQESIASFAWALIGLSLIVAALTFLQKALEDEMEAFQVVISTHYAVDMMNKLLHMDYANLESYEGRAKFERCKNFAFEGMWSDGAWAMVRLTGLITGILGIATYGALFSGVSLWLLVIIAVFGLIEFWTYAKSLDYGEKVTDEMVPGEMKFYYFYRIATAPAVGKDIRLSGAADWLLYHMAKAAAAYMKIMRWYTVKVTKLNGVQALCTIGRDLATFGFLIVAARDGNLALGDFLFYFGLVTGFSDWMNGLSGHVASLNRIGKECGHYRAFLELPDRPAGTKKANFDKIDSIEFRHVSFAYPSEDSLRENTLTDINFTLQSGENVAIVGENGAGKTTLIKLLCGLYQPTEGEILVNGINILDYDPGEYLDLISAIFQDYILLPADIRENIAPHGSESDEDIWNILKQIGLDEKIRQVGLDAKLVKQMNSTSLDLSGGEKQRLLLARALYKDAPILVLDEPTATLDPIAEEKLYLQYDELTEDKISIFISHRLTSTRFCSRIFMMQQGKITESGSHEELMQLNGAYRKMYEVQGYYYQEAIEQ